MSQKKLENQNAPDPTPLTFCKCLAPLALSFIMKQAMGNISHSITTRNHPLPVSLSDNGQETFSSTLGTAFVVSFTVIFGMFKRRVQYGEHNDSGTTCS
jgi:hypothetical protein